MDQQQFQLLVELINGLRDELREHKQEVARQFAKVDTQFFEIKDLIKDEKREREKMEDKLEKVYESRDRVTVQFSRVFAGANIIFASLVALLTSAFTLLALQ